MTAGVLCDIVAGKAPASIVYRDDECCAFMDIQPVTPGHVLVVRVLHASYLADLDEETGAHMFRVAQRVAQALRGGGLKCEGVNLFLADGIAAGQEVFHVHLHVLPRYRGDAFGLRFGLDYGNQPPKVDLDRVASIIRKALL